MPTHARAQMEHSTEPSPIMFNLDDVDQHHLADGGQLVSKLPAQFTDVVLLDECIDGTILMSVNFIYERVCYRIGYVPIPLTGMAYTHKWDEKKWSVGIISFRGNGGIPAQHPDLPSEELPDLKPMCSIILQDANITDYTEDDMARLVAVNSARTAEVVQRLKFTADEQGRIALTDMLLRTEQCVLCNALTYGNGYDPAPLADHGRCCMACSALKVRMHQVCSVCKARMQ